jgi:pilus assembly protein CpaB
MILRRLTMALLMALCVSGLCTYLLGRKLSERPKERAPELRYVSPSRAMQAGEVLKPDMLELVAWPASNALPDAFAKPEDVIGRSLLYPLDKGQPITGKLVSAPGAGAGLAGRIPDGMRAIALRSDEVMGVAGFLLPGSHVDVVVTYHTDKSPEPVTATVLQDSEVIAAGHQIQPDPEGKPATVTVVTLLLTPEDAERAVLASTQGAIHFILRSNSDKQKVEQAPIVLSQLTSEAPHARINPDAEPAHVARVRAQAPASHAPYVVETILGDKVTTSTFNAAEKP